MHFCVLFSISEKIGFIVTVIRVGWPNERSGGLSDCYCKQYRFITQRVQQMAVT